jgi:hypothetical protein
MGLSPKYRAGPKRSGARATPPATASAPAPGAATSGDGRWRRPIPERTAPLRAPSGALRREAPAQSPQTVALAPGGGGGPSAIEEAVSTAYQVFDRYLEEGRQFAQGQSAWYGNAEGQPELTRDAARTFADFLGIVGRLARELHGFSGAFPTVQPSTATYARSAEFPARLPIMNLDEEESIAGWARAGPAGTARGAGGRAPGPLDPAPSAMHVAPVGSAGGPVTPTFAPPAAPTEPLTSPIRNVEPTTVPVGEVKTLAQASRIASGLPPRGAVVARAPVSEWEAVANSLTPSDPRDELRWPGGVKRPGQ